MNSFIPWVGGKKLLRKEIIKLFPREFERYIEVFGGAGWVLFGKESSPKQMEVFNDIDGHLINLYRCIKYHCDELQKELQYILNAREVFFDAREQNGMRGLTDIQRAARYFYLVRYSFGADKHSYCTSPKAVCKPVEYLSQITKRLEKVVIENKSFDNLIHVYDRAGALFYLDPPYVGTEKYYNSNFGKVQHEELKSILDGIQGKFILSYNNCQYIKDLYASYNITLIARNHNLKTNGTRYQELIITNY